MDEEERRRGERKRRRRRRTTTRDGGTERKEELDERLRKADEFLRQMMNESSILPEGFIQKMSKVLGDQNKLFSSFEEIFRETVGRRDV